MTRPSLREYAAVQRERYLAATRAEKGALLDEVVAVTGLHGKAATSFPRVPHTFSDTPNPRDLFDLGGLRWLRGPATTCRRTGRWASALRSGSKPVLIVRHVLAVSQHAVETC